MAKFASDAVLDASPDFLIANVDTEILCSAQPANYAGIAAVELARVAVDSGDFTKADGDTSGRKVTVAAQNAVEVTASGDGTHICLVDVGATTLHFVTTCPTQGVVDGGTVDLGEFDIEFSDPA